MTDTKTRKGWLRIIFFLTIIAIGLSILNTSLILNDGTSTLKAAIAYTDRRVADQRAYADQRTLELREEYLGIARQQATSNRYLIFLSCTAREISSKCKEEQEELDQLQLESEQQRTIQPNQQEK